MTTGKRFPAPIVEALERAKIIGIRAGEEHRYTGVWVVVVEGRSRPVLATADGLAAGFPARAAGACRQASASSRSRARPRSERLRDAVTTAYAQKYNTKASQRWVTGFAEPERLRATLELVPA
jgi:hypothetical protein